MIATKVRLYAARRFALIGLTGRPVALDVAKTLSGRDVPCGGGEHGLRGRSRAGRVGARKLPKTLTNFALLKPHGEGRL
jgi:hypothetical protein